MTNHNFLPALADSNLTEGNGCLSAVLAECRAAVQLAPEAAAAAVRAAAAAHTFALWADVSSLVGAE